MKPTPKQRAFLAKRGIEIPETKQECIELIGKILEGNLATELSLESYGDR